MSTVIFILIATGIIFLALFHKPVNHSEAELKKWFSSRLEQITENLEKDINKDKNGEYPHSGVQTFEKRGKITYVLLDKKNTRFEVSDKNKLRVQDIIDTAGYRKLEARAQRLGLAVQLDENMVEGDGVQTFNELDEYIRDYPRYYSVTISGW